MVEVVQMSLKEADRYAVIQQVIQRTMGQSDAALWLNLSVRQVKRLTRAIRQDGAQGAVSKRWGVPSNRRTSQAVRDQFVGLVRANYSDFGPTLACEYLASQHGYSGSAETLRGWMIEAGGSMKMLPFFSACLRQVRLKQEPPGSQASKRHLRRRYLDRPPQSTCASNCLPSRE